MKEQIEHDKILSDFLKLENDQTGRRLFTYKKFLAWFLKLFFPMFKDMSIDEIIKQSIDWGDSKPTFIEKSLAEEGKFRLVSLVKEEFVVLLRFPNYLQSGKKERFFILHINIENSEDKKKLNRKIQDHQYGLYHSINIAPFDNEDEREENITPIYSITILLRPNKRDKGKIVNMDYYKAEGKIDKNNLTFSYSAVENDDETIYENYRIYLDDNLSEDDRKTPSLQGLLSVIAKVTKEQELENWINVYNLRIPELIEEVEKMSALEEAFVNKGIEIGEKRGFKNGKKEGFKEGVKYHADIVYQNAIILGLSEEQAKEIAYIEPTSD